MRALLATNRCEHFWTQKSLRIYKLKTRFVDSNTFRSRFVFRNLPQFGSEFGAFLDGYIISLEKMGKLCVLNQMFFKNIFYKTWKKLKAHDKCFWIKTVNFCSSVKAFCYGLEPPFCLLWLRGSSHLAVSTPAQKRGSGSETRLKTQVNTCLSQIQIYTFSFYDFFQ